MKLFLQVLVLFLSTTVIAQTQLSGTVSDSSGQPIPGANIVINNTTGTVTDFDGNFSLSTDKNPPFTVTISSVGLASKSIEVTSATQSLSVVLDESTTQLDEIVVSASRFAQRIFESPITVEKFGLQQIKETPAADFFNGLENLKGIQLSQGGFLLNQVITRGFGTVYNEGFVTLVDGMNNMSPLFGFAMGNLIGLDELDVQSIEVIPGPASALYGADAYKGIMFLNSKNPFEHEGVSAYYRTGVTEQDAAGTNDFTQIGIRMATKIGDKFAIKASLSHKEGTEWGAAEYSHQPMVGGEVDPTYSTSAPDYNGLNIYGERAFPSSSTWGLLGLLDPATAALAAAAPNYFDDVVTTGYKDKDLVSDNAQNTKGNFAMHYRPDEKTEIVLSSLIGSGESPLQGFGRYAMKGIKIQQHKFQVDHGRLNFKTYYTREQDGDSYSISAAAALLANAPNSNIADLSALGLPSFTGYGGWFANYNLTYLGTLAGANGLTADIAGITSLLGIIGGDIMTGGQSINNLAAFAPLGGNTQFAHNAARSNADLGINPFTANPVGMLVPGTDAYIATLAQATSSNLPVVNGGSGIFDDTETYNFELNYDLTDVTDFADFLVGASYRMTELNSGGTIYSDQDGPIEYYEYGAYVQGVKKLLNDKLSLTASMRIDKSEFFDANYTPRLAGLYNIDENQNVRFSFQTGFRNPTNQDQYIGLFAGDVTLLGTSPDNIGRYNGTVVLTNGNVATFTGDYVFNNALNEAGTSANLKYVTPERVTSYDLGYRFKSQGLTVDVSAYYSDYENKIGSTDAYVPYLDNTAATPITLSNYRALGSYAIYQADSNSDEDLKTYGISAEVTQALSSKLLVNVIYDYNKLDFSPDPNSSFEAAFNTPEHTIKAGLLGKFGIMSFNVSARNTSEYYYEASFIDGMIDARTVLDAQVSFDIAPLNAVLKFGGNNIGGDEYQSVLGGGNIGSVYYSSISFDL
ncbi:MAG: TonB-dependent receptor [Flavobacteriaceae bacterium]|nr:TonB-dependent receptor [Flavobacteriaceae bacterium]